MKLLLFLLMPFAVFAPEIDDSRVDISWLNGHWKGLGYQTNSDNTWTIDLYANVKKNKFTIDYASLNCAGKWTLVETFENRVIFKEKIEEGIDRCVPTGTVIVTRVNARYISYTFFEKIGGELVLAAFSTLEKVD